MENFRKSTQNHNGQNIWPINDPPSWQLIQGKVKSLRTNLIKTMKTIKRRKSGHIQTKEYHSYLLYMPKREKDTQRHNIFKIRSIVNERVCDLIIDNVSRKNLVSKTMIDKLQFKTQKHPFFILHWMDKRH